MREVAAILEQLVGKPCWGVRHGYGSFVTAEFGAPHLSVREGNPSAIRESLRRRQITVRGEWHLWIYCCNWRYEEHGQVIAHSENSDAEIDHAVVRIDSQELQQMQVSSATGATSFLFEGGGILHTTPYDSGEELWQVFTPAGAVLSIKAGGLVSLAQSTTVCGDEHWRPLGRDLTIHSTGPAQKAAQAG